MMAHDDGGPAVYRAAAFLTRALDDGARPASAILHDARAASINEKTLRRAKTRLGVVARKEGWGAAGRWWWGPAGWTWADVIGRDETAATGS